MPDLLARRKQGFSPPFSAWARGPLREYVSERLSHERVTQAGVLDPEPVERLVTQHLSGAADRSRTLWTLLSLQMWAECWLLGSVPKPLVAEPALRAASEASPASAAPAVAVPAATEN